MLSKFESWWEDKYKHYILEQIFYIVYKITFLKGKHKGSYYIGRHRTNDLNDGYTGSGKFPMRYFSKYGKEEGITYLKEILGFYDNDEELDNAEICFINEVLGKDDKCMNICPGGGVVGGWSRGKTLSEEHKKKISFTLMGHVGSWRGKNLPKDVVEKIANSNRGKKRTEEQIKHMSESRKGKSPNLSEEVREKKRQLMILKNKDPEYIKKILNGMKNRSPEARRQWLEKTSRANKGRIGMTDLDGKHRKVKPEEVENKLKLGWKKGFHNA